MVNLLAGALATAERPRGQGQPRLERFEIQDAGPPAASRLAGTQGSLGRGGSDASAWKGSLGDKPHLMAMPRMPRLLVWLGSAMLLSVLPAGIPAPGDERPEVCRIVVIAAAVEALRVGDGLDAVRSWSCRGTSYPRSRPDFSRRRRPALKPLFSRAVHTVAWNAASGCGYRSRAARPATLERRCGRKWTWASSRRPGPIPTSSSTIPISSWTTRSLAPTRSGSPAYSSSSSACSQPRMPYRWRISRKNHASGSAFRSTIKSGAGGATG